MFGNDKIKDGKKIKDRQVVQLKKNKNIVRYKKTANINIGIIIFVIIFIYLVFNIFSYLTETHISKYEVEQGTIAANNVFHGLILREEKIYSSEYTGSLNYYVKEGSKIAYGNLVCSVDESGDVSNLINEANEDGSNIDAENLAEIEKDILDFQYSYNSKNFYQVYTFKDSLNAVLDEALSVHALNEISDYISAAEGKNTFHKMYSDTPGIVIYSTDGFENVNADNFSSAMFDESEYSKVNLKSGTDISAGNPAYKLITSELWNIVVPVPKSTAELLKDDSILKIRFLKDAKETYANYAVEEQDGQFYLILSLKSGMVRYAAERYVEIELLLSEETGLKIPNSAITQKEFFTIPSDYFLKGGDSNEYGLLIERTDKNGKKTTEFITPTIYFEKDKLYYIDSENVSAGDIIKKQDSGDSYIVGSDTAALQGVYNINKGYAVFKQIDILYQNEEYTIVKTGTKYGIALYDHIALDGTKIRENQLIN